MSQQHNLQYHLVADTQLIRNTDMFSSVIDEELVMMNSEGNYFALNQTARKIWEILEHACSYETLLERLLINYDIKSLDCKTEVKDFLIELLQYKLVFLVNN